MGCHCIHDIRPIPAHEADAIQALQKSLNQCHSQYCSCGFKLTEGTAIDTELPAVTSAEVARGHPSLKCVPVLFSPIWCRDILNLLEPSSGVVLIMKG